MLNHSIYYRVYTVAPTPFVRLGRRAVRFTLTRFHPRALISLFLVLLQTTAPQGTKISPAKSMAIFYVVVVCETRLWFYHATEACCAILKERERR